MGIAEEHSVHYFWDFDFFLQVTDAQKTGILDPAEFLKIFKLRNILGAKD